MEDKKQRKYMPTIKDIVHYVTTIVILISIFLAFKYKVQNIEEKVMQHEKMLQDTNLELINYKVGRIEKKQDDFIEKFNTFITDYYRNN